MTGNLTELLEAVDEVIAAEDLALADIRAAGGNERDMADPHIDRLRQVRMTFAPSPSFQNEGAKK